MAELRAALRPGETFLKLTTLNRRIYGMVVTADRTYLYQVAESEAARGAVLELAGQLRQSIDGDLGLGKLVPFDEARAYTLYRLVSGRRHRYWRRRARSWSIRRDRCSNCRSGCW